VSDDQFRQQLVGNGVPIEAADVMLSIFAAVDPRNSRLGALSLLDPTMIKSPSRQSSLLTASSTVAPSTIVDVTGIASGRAPFAASRVS